MGSLEIALDGVPILILVGCIVWIVRFNISQQKGERLTLKWKDMDPFRKAVAALIFVWICLNLYLTVGNELAFLNVVVLPLGSVHLRTYSELGISLEHSRTGRLTFS